MLLFINISAYCSSSDSMKIYVAVNGNDNWSGFLNKPNTDKTDGPLATIVGAKGAVRKLRSTGKMPEGNVIVEILEGRYEMPQALELNAGDSGTDPSSRLIYQGETGKEVRLSGGRTLKKWEQVTDKIILKRFNPVVRGKIYCTDLSAAGITNFGSPAGDGPELFFNDKPMWISRYPNKGFIPITGVLNEDPVDVRGTKGDKVGKFMYDENRIAQWKDEKDAWVHGYWFWDWSDQRHKIKKIDTGKRIIEVVPPYHNYGYRTGQWFYGFNLLSEIDEPGEYYIDRTDGILYFYPPSDINKGTAFISLNKNIIQLNGVSYVTIEGMILEGCRETAVTMLLCNNTLIKDCTIRNVGDWAVTINEGFRSGVAGCHIYDAGAGGIRIDAGDRKKLISAECFAENNNIHHIARLKRVYNPGVSITGTGNIISHNVIAHVPHMAIGSMGNENLIEYNEIYDACYESNDAGAIYTGRNWTMRGNIIRYNYLHDISGFEGKGCVGIYLDDSFSSADVTGNVFKNVTRAMMIGGGRDNSVTNNIFINCDPSIHVDARGMGWMSGTIDAWISEANEKGTILGIEYDKPPYSTRYPELKHILKDEPAAPKGNIISRNICAGGNWDKASGFWNVAIEGKARPFQTMEYNIIAPGTAVEDSLSTSIIIADPLFVNQDDPEKGNFRLDEASPAIKYGFEQIPFEKIGLYRNEIIACGDDKVIIFEHKKADNDEVDIVWNWKVSEADDLPPTYQKYMVPTDECKPVDGNRILITSSGGGVVLVDRNTKKCIFYTYSPMAHSAELLPGNRIAVVLSTDPKGNSIELYDINNSEKVVFKDSLYSGHGVVWMNSMKKLFALGYNELRSYALKNWNSENPELILAEKWKLPDNGGHDLSYVSDSLMILTTSKGVWKFNTVTRQFSSFDQLKDERNVKSVNYSKNTGELIYTRGEISWWTHNIYCKNHNKVYSIPDINLYKVRVNPIK